MDSLADSKKLDRSTQSILALQGKWIKAINDVSLVMLLFIYYYYEV